MLHAVVGVRVSRQRVGRLEASRSATTGTRRCSRPLPPICQVDGVYLRAQTACRASGLQRRTPTSQPRRLRSWQPSHSYAMNGISSRRLHELTEPIAAHGATPLETGESPGGPLAKKPCAAGPGRFWFKKREESTRKYALLVVTGHG